MSGWNRLVSRVLPRPKAKRIDIPHLPLDRAIWLGWQTMFGHKAKIYEDEFFVYRIQNSGKYAWVTVRHVLTGFWTNSGNVHWENVDKVLQSDLDYVLNKVRLDRLRIKAKNIIREIHD